MANRNIAIKCEMSHLEELTLFYDKRRLEQILHNLLTNAIKFTTSGEISIVADIKESEESDS